MRTEKYGSAANQYPVLTFYGPILSHGDVAIISNIIHWISTGMLFGATIIATRVEPILAAGASVIGNGVCLNRSRHGPQQREDAPEVYARARVFGKATIGLTDLVNT